MRKTALGFALLIGFYLFVGKWGREYEMSFTDFAAENLLMVTLSICCIAYYFLASRDREIRHIDNKLKN